LFKAAVTGGGAAALGGSSITNHSGLAFTPTVLGDRTINLKVEPEVSHRLHRSS
jgi:Flp pilus assembly secretin CpaC